MGSRILSDTIRLNLRRVLLSVIPLSQARRLVDSAGRLGFRDAMMALPGFNSLPPRGHVFLIRWALGRFKEMHVIRGDNCRRCSQPFPTTSIHSLQCESVRNSGIATHRHNAVRDVLFSVFKQTEKYLVGIEQAVIIPHSPDTNNRTDVTASGPWGGRTFARVDIDVTIKSSFSATQERTDIQALLDSGHNGKVNHYAGVHAAGVRPEVYPFVMTDLGVIDARSNTLLYELVNSICEGWRIGHILNSLSVQHWRARLANAALQYACIAHLSTLPSEILGQRMGAVIGRTNRVFTVDRYGCEVIREEE